ncbi:hypothetical protein Pmani_035200 [Petrolisthes manimaculis]|uniref:Uncharacterized protein n=1 Tax=Petrolisthes manimaculis TaxID=1843537 RepID=A0AAE1NL83_9EUCA|nr:hypothetical protein Pmani_035200 [Petrolisthes manimaculis]
MREGVWEKREMSVTHLAACGGSFGARRAIRKVPEPASATPGYRHCHHSLTRWRGGGRCRRGYVGGLVPLPTLALHHNILSAHTEEHTHSRTFTSLVIRLWRILQGQSGSTLGTCQPVLSALDARAAPQCHPGVPRGASRLLQDLLLNQS